MEEDLLTILTSRWGQRQSEAEDHSKPSERVSGAGQQQAVALVSSPINSWGEAVAQAQLLNDRLIADGCWAALVIRSKSSGGSLINIIRSWREYLGQLKALMAEREVAHVLIDRPQEFWLTAVPAILMARFYGLSVVLNLIGDWPTKVGLLHSRLLKPWLGLAELVLVSAGTSAIAKVSLRREVSELGPLVDLDSLPQAARKRVQPSLLVDARNLDLVAIRELIAGCQIAKEKYPRTECTLLLNESMTARVKSGLENGTGHGVNILSRLEPAQLPSVVDGADIFLTGTGSALVDPFLLEAAARGLPLLVGRNSQLAATLKNDYQFEPLKFQNRSDLADAIIILVEQPELVDRLGWQAKALAEQFAWDNILPRIQAQYAGLARTQARRS